MTMFWRAFDKTVSRKPLAFAVDAIHGNSIDLGLESHPGFRSPQPITSMAWVPFPSETMRTAFQWSCRSP